MSASSRLKLSELRTPRRRSRARPLLVSSRTPGNLAGELHEVADSLRDTNRRLDDTEDLFESYRDVTRRQEEMITDVRARPSSLLFLSPKWGTPILRLARKRSRSIAARLAERKVKRARDGFRLRDAISRFFCFRRRKTKRRSIVRFVDDDSSGSTDGIDKRRR